MIKSETFFVAHSLRGDKGLLLTPWAIPEAKSLFYLPVANLAWGSRFCNNECCNDLDKVVAIVGSPAKGAALIAAGHQVINVAIIGLG